MCFRSRMWLRPGLTIRQNSSLLSCLADFLQEFLASLCCRCQFRRILFAQNSCTPTSKLLLSRAGSRAPCTDVRLTLPIPVPYEGLGQPIWQGPHSSSCCFLPPTPHWPYCILSASRGFCSRLRFTRWVPCSRSTCCFIPAASGSLPTATASKVRGA